jgi:putative CocE/NonD family hydrolase
VDTWKAAWFRSKNWQAIAATSTITRIDAAHKLKETVLPKFTRALAVVCLLLAVPGAFAGKRKHVAAAPAENASAPAIDLKPLEGAYTGSDDPDTPLSVYVQNGRLMCESERRVPKALESQAANEFQIEGSRARIRFAVDGSGHATALTVSSDAGEQYKRTGEPVHHVFHDYVRSEAMIPMRDGVKLHVVILKPADMKEPLPFLIQRTPYGVEETTREWFFAARPELARAGYIYVGADIRGRYKSEGTFVMSRPLVDHRKPKATDESTDTWDTVDWLVKNVAGNNGRTGFVGTSYPGFLAMMAGIDPHPGVRAISPQAPMIDVWMGDDFFHNGAFRQTYGYDYVLEMESSKEDTGVSYGKDAAGKPVDGFDFFLKRGNFAGDAKQSGTRLLPTWKLFLKQPEYGPKWRARAVENAMKAVNVPTLTVGGYYDQEDMFGPQVEYERLEPNDTKHQNFLVLGPWRHGSWGSSQRSLGNLEYGQPIGKEFREQIEAKFFGHYLKDEAGFDVEDTASFQTGSNTWKRYAHFPPQEARTESLYLGAAGALSWKAPVAQAKTSYVSDPANPVPYRQRPIQPTYGEGSKWRTWMVEDQRFVEGRKDVAVWKLPVQEKDLTVTGEVVADIFAATTGTDNDLVVKLIDEYPADGADQKMRGYQLLTNAEIFRGRYLDSFSRATPIAAGAVREYKFSLHGVDHVFKAGHRIVVEVQSTWFPLYDRNPQTFVKNIMKATPGAYKAETITVYGGDGRASRVVLPVVGK